jgi:uncharacterized membrane protein YgcG
MNRAFPLFALMLLASPAAADRGAYVIESFDVDLEVQQDSELLVRERLVVRFSEPRHGIYRTIPIRYTDPRGYLYSLGFRFVDAVDDDGAAHMVELSREGSYAKIRIGEPDRTVSGRVVYVLRYRVRDAVQHFAEHDELYWNATGNEWQASIESASATVRLPGPVERASLEAAAYTGVFGSKSQDARIEHPEDGVVVYRAAQSLRPLEGLTVVAAWPHGLVRFPGPLAGAIRLIAANWIVLFPFLALGFLSHRYRTAGRDPEGPAAVVVRYEPPPDLTAGEIGALVDERVDLRDITASVVDLAVRGYVKIHVTVEAQLFGLWKSEQTSFERLNRPRDDLRPYEREILEGIFASGSFVSTKDLEEKFYRHIPGIRESVWDDLDRRQYVAGKPTTVRKTWKFLGVVAAAATFGIGYAWASYQGALFPHAHAAPLLSAIVVALLFLAFSPAMPRRTRKGVHSRAWALGFEEFVDRVEREKLDADRQRNVFEALLPYAMALGVAAAWARKFEGIYRNAAPIWFSGPGSLTGSTSFSTSSFERSLSSAMGRAGSGMTSAPRSSGSSGSGGGGSSGGGGGGGGGGSW